MCVPLFSLNIIHPTKDKRTSPCIATVITADNKWDTQTHRHTLVHMCTTQARASRDYAIEEALGAVQDVIINVSNTDAEDHSYERHCTCHRVHTRSLSLFLSLSVSLCLSLSLSVSICLYLSLSRPNSFSPLQCFAECLCAAATHAALPCTQPPPQCAAPAGDVFTGFRRRSG